MVAAKAPLTQGFDHSATVIGIPDHAFPIELGFGLIDASHAGRGSDLFISVHSPIFEPLCEGAAAQLRQSGGKRLTNG